MTGAEACHRAREGDKKWPIGRSVNLRQGASLQNFARRHDRFTSEATRTTRHLHLELFGRGRLVDDLYAAVNVRRRVAGVATPIVTIARAAARFLLPDIFDIASPSCAACAFSITSHVQMGRRVPVARRLVKGSRNRRRSIRIIVNAPRNLRIP